MKANPHEYRIRSVYNREAFAKLFLPHYFTRKFSVLHRWLFDKPKVPFRLRSYGKRIAVAAPRGSGKSVIVSLLEPLHDLCYGFEPFVVLMAHTTEQASGLATAIRAELEHNELIREAFPELYPIRGGTTDFTTANGRRLAARSVGQQIRGIRHRQFRPTKIILDDIEHSEAVQRFSRREEFEEYINRDVLQAGTPRTNVVHVGTILHPDSLLAKHLSSPGWDSRKFKALEGWPERIDLWNECRKIWSNLANPNREEEARTFFEANKQEMSKGARLLDPELEDLFDLMVVLWRDGEAAFMAEKQNEPRRSKKALLPMEHAQTFKRQGDVIYLASGQTVPLSSLVLTAWLDTSLGNATGGDPAAIAVVGRDGTDRFYVLDGWVEHKPPSEQIARLISFMRVYGISRAGFEDNGFQRLLKSEFDRQKRLQRLERLSLVGYTTKSPKTARIAALEPMISNGWLAFDEKLVGTPFWEQFVRFPDGHDDAPDAVERSIWMLSQRLRVFEYL